MPISLVFDVKNLVIVPIFEKNPNELHDSLNIITTLFTYYYYQASHNNIQNILLAQGILRKLSGKAKKQFSFTATILGNL